MNFPAFVTRSAEWLYGLFRKPAPLDAVVVKFPQPRREKRRDANPADVEENGGFYFKSSILDHLEEYFVYIRRMKRADPEAYQLFSRIGASVLPRGMLTAQELSPLWRGGLRPAFGATAFGVGTERSDKWIHAKFIYFRKLKRPPAMIEPSNGTVYSLVCYHDDQKDKHLAKWRHGYPSMVYVDVASDGSIRALKELQTKFVSIKSKKGTFEIPRRRWDYSDSLLDWAAEHKVGISELASKSFLLAINSFEQSTSHVRVAVSKGADTATFGIDIKRTPYFFSDREVFLNKHGSKARIFHIVRAHKRTGASGAERYVKFHFRGLRDFTWNGYSVHISVPGLHHNNLIELDAGSYEFPDNDPMPPGMMDNREFGKRLSTILHR